MECGQWPTTCYIFGYFIFPFYLMLNFRHLCTLGHTDSVYCCTVPLDGVLLTGSSDRSIRVWNIPSQACLQIITVSQHVTSLLWSEGFLFAGLSERCGYAYQATARVVAFHTCMNGEVFSIMNNGEDLCSQMKGWVGMALISTPSSLQGSKVASWYFHHLLLVFFSVGLNFVD